MTKKELDKFRIMLRNMEIKYFTGRGSEYEQQRRRFRDEIISDFEKIFNVTFSPDERDELLTMTTGWDIIQAWRDTINKK